VFQLAEIVKTKARAFTKKEQTEVEFVIAVKY
jgi:hypothetical protein